jgi:F-type H+-transporting ATPase subunit b
MFELNATVLVFIISFLIFMVLLNEIMLKPVGKVLEARANKIKSDLDAAKLAHADAEKSLKHYEEHLHQVREEAQSVINKSVDSANKIRSEKFSKIKADGQTKLESAKQVIASEREKLMQELVGQETALVEEIATKLLGEKATVKLNADAVQKALEGAC